ncbi:hypothetical protein Ccur_06160 [Cryptobacterium curtum DSM 15641]|uniref:Uncharacterized protein n=1 Tax=Cryptobacterium curtum (strain ATCC 700683 / DSM 15641 / CCUG 43107 / 12-3) TaxID=469378 RepID=C7MN42_CRYCD|nr:hypothetical protein [Cryptobacterium curtum]ACU94332.1 hypothetical protein Ccur_06160 [Cryptobacterium curtum DSM 15641]
MAESIRYAQHSGVVQSTVSAAPAYHQPVVKNSAPHCSFAAGSSARYQSVGGKSASHHQVASGTPTPRRHLLSDISPVQVVATALAALTSMLLSSQIGITGSIIGVFVGSVVSTVSAQLYRNMVSISADKMHARTASTAGSQTASQPQASGRVGSGVESNQSTGAAARENTFSVQAARASVYRNSPSSAITGQVDRSNISQAYATDARLRARDRRDAKARLSRRVIIVSVVSALVAILLSALAVNLVTAGQGLGTKTSIVSSSVQAVDDKPASSASSSTAQTATQNSTVSDSQDDSQATNTTSTDAQDTAQTTTTKTSSVQDTTSTSNTPTTTDSSTSSNKSSAANSSSTSNTTGSGSETSSSTGKTAGSSSSSAAADSTSTSASKTTTSES